MDCMRNAILVCLVLISLTLSGQGKQTANQDKNLVELQKQDNIYSCFYSDTNAKFSSDLKSFQFPNVDRVYEIIMNGFEKGENHKTYVLTNDDTVVRFEFSKISGEVQLKIKHNNLINNYVGATSYLNKEQVVHLFKDFI